MKILCVATAVDHQEISEKSIRKFTSYKHEIKVKKERKVSKRALKAS